MATTYWQGDSGSTAQVDTGTIALTWAAADTMTTTLTLEDGTTATTESTTVASSTLETNIDLHLAELQANTNAEFLKITWAKGSSTTITATAKTAGVPFYCTMGETTAGNGTWARSATTANAGPNDWGTALNWSGGSVPSAGDIVKINDGSIDILYGLATNDVDLGGLHIADGYSGTIGDIPNTYYLIIGVSNTGAVNKPSVTVNGRGSGILLKPGATSWDNLYLMGGLNTPHMLKIGAGTGTMVNFYCSSADAQGTVTIAGASKLGTIKIHDAPGIKMLIGESVTGLNDLAITSGTHIIDTCDFASTDSCVIAGTADVTFRKDTTAFSNTTGLQQFGGKVTYQAPNTLTTLLVEAGEFVGDARDGSITITNATIYGGGITERTGGRGITWSNNIIQEGGDVQAETGLTVNPGA